MRQCCASCGASDAVERHHPDYGDPHNIEWLCGNCHRVLHRAAAEAQWRAFKERSDTRAAAWVAGEGGSGVARFRKRTREARRRARDRAQPMTAVEKAADSIGNYELALAEIRRRR
jgi:hypothetical protein